MHSKDHSAYDQGITDDFVYKEHFGHNECSAEYSVKYQNSREDCEYNQGIQGNSSQC